MEDEFQFLYVVFMLLLIEHFLLWGPLLVRHSDSGLLEDGFCPRFRLIRGVKPTRILTYPFGVGIWEVFSETEPALDTRKGVRCWSCLNGQSYLWGCRKPCSFRWGCVTCNDCVGSCPVGTVRIFHVLSGWKRRLVHAGKIAHPSFSSYYYHVSFCFSRHEFVSRVSVERWLTPLSAREGRGGCTMTVKRLTRVQAR